MKIYGIPGLGADERVYQELNKFLRNKITPLSWLQPEKEETLEGYLFRFKAQIDEKSPFILVGVSFGGMVAVELNKYLSPHQTIIISSSASRKELPFLFRILTQINIIRFIPNHFLKPPIFLSNWLFGVKSPQHRKLLKQIIDDTDVVFLKWAIQQIVGWKNKEVPERLVRIHGTSDRLLKMNKNETTMIIKGGGHLMVIEKAKEIADFLMFKCF
jgi:hypothetical protein